MSKHIRNSAAVAALLAAVGQANAAIPADVTAAITAAGTDGLALVGALAVAGAGVFLIAKLLKRFGLSF